MVDEVLDAVAPKKQVSTKNKKKTSQATGLIADVADDTSSPRVKADAVPDTSGSKYKNTGNSTGKKNSSAAAKNRKTEKTSTVRGNSKKGNTVSNNAGGMSKNQQKMQNQTVGSTLSGGTTGKISSDIISSGSGFGTKEASNRNDIIDGLKGAKVEYKKTKQEK